MYHTDGNLGSYMEMQQQKLNLILKDCLSRYLING
jgi:hypothetical protein